MYPDAGPAPKVVSTPGGRKPLVEARKNVCGVSETHSTTGTLYNLSNKMQKHRRPWRRSNENAADLEWRKAHAQKGSLVIRTAPSCCAPWDSTTPHTVPRLPCELQPRDWVIIFLSCQHEGNDSKPPVGSEPRRRYLHQHNLCSIMSAMTDGEAYSALANAENPTGAMQRLKTRLQAVPPLTDVERDLCDSVDKVWFFQRMARDSNGILPLRHRLHFDQACC